MFKKFFVTSSIFLIVSVLLILTTPQGQSALRTALFIPQILAGVSFKPQQWFIQEPVHRRVDLQFVDDNVSMDIYLPTGSGTHSAVVLYMGVVPPDRDEHRIVSLAEGLARSGFIVVIPWLDTQQQNRLITRDIDKLVQVFQHVTTLDRVDPERVGMAGICTGASMVMIAAQDIRIRNQVKFINFFAGYYDAIDLVKAIGTRSRFYGDEIRPWNPDTLTMTIVTYHLIEGVDDLRDRHILSRIFIGHESVDETEIHTLNTEAKAVLAILNGTSFEHIDNLIEQLPAETLDYLKLISPSNNIENLNAKVFIMHDRADNLVPSEESRRLFEAIKGKLDVHYTEFSFFQNEIEVHTADGENISKVKYVIEAWKLYSHIYHIMREIS